MEIATYEKYLPELYKEFPDINKKSIKDVCQHGLALMGFFQTKGHDIYLNNNIEKTYFYSGLVTNVPEKRYEISRKKYRRKLRLMHSLNKVPYSGYMYFVLNEEDYTVHLKGEPLKYYLFKVFEETKLYLIGKYYFKVPMENPHKWIMILENHHINNAEQIN